MLLLDLLRNAISLYVWLLLLLQYNEKPQWCVVYPRPARSRTTLTELYNQNYFLKTTGKQTLRPRDLLDQLYNPDLSHAKTDQLEYRPTQLALLNRYTGILDYLNLNVATDIGNPISGNTWYTM